MPSFGRATPPWDSDALARWFAAHAARVPFSSPRALWWTPRRGTPRHGWVLPSTEILSFPAYTEKSPRRLSMFIEKDGTRWQHGRSGSTRVLRANFLAEGGELHVSALVEMARLLRLVNENLRLGGPPPAPS